MEKLKITSSSIASLSTIRQRISPYRKTGLYMELHKLDYERTNLYTKLEKMELERKNLEKRLSMINNDMQEMLDTLKEKNITETSEDSPVKGQSLRY